MSLGARESLRRRRTLRSGAGSSLNIITQRLNFIIKFATTQQRGEGRNKEACVAAEDMIERLVYLQVIAGDTILI